MSTDPSVDPAQPETDPPINPDDSPADPPKADESVALRDHERALADIKKLKARNQELEDGRKAEERKRLEESENWQELAERNKTEADDWQRKYEGLSTTIVRDKKLSAVREHCLALRIKKEALADLDMLDLEGVDVETTSLGNINVVGAKAFADRLKMSKPHWFGGTGGRVNTDLPLENAGGGKVTLAQLKTLGDKAKKTGDYSAYERALNQFRVQQNQ